MEIIDNNAERALSPTSIDLADYVINPYKGCTIGCTYCYSRRNKGISKINLEWGDYVYIKQNLPELLNKELDCLESKKIKKILLGSTTEVFQPAEENHGITRRILEILKDREIPVVILTKMKLIIEYIDLLKYSKGNTVYFTYNSEKVRDLFEKRGDSQSQRRDAIAALRKNNINLAAYVSPAFPFLTDVKKIFEELQGITDNVFFEAYNIKMGNWFDIRKKIEDFDAADDGIISEYERIFFNENEYYAYWNGFVSSVNSLNSAYGYKLKFYIYNYDSYYYRI